MGLLDFSHVVVLPVQSFVYTAPAITSDQDELITTDQARLRLHLSSGEDLKAASITSTPACFVSCSKLRAELGGRARSRVDDLRRAGTALRSLTVRCHWQFAIIRRNNRIALAPTQPLTKTLVSSAALKCSS